LDAIFTPEVGLADVVVIGDGDGGTVAHDVAELHAEFEPAGGVLGVVIGLVACEEEDVGILRDEVLDDGREGSGGAGGVAGKVADDDGFLIGGFAADLAFKGRFFGVAKSVSVIFGAVPVGDAEVGGPAGIDDLFLGDFFPLIALFDLEANFLGLIRLERVELRGHLQRAAFEGVNGKADHFTARDIEVDHALASFFGRSLSFPPFTGGTIIEAAVFLSENLGGGGHELSAGGEDES